ncbi:hypothetical protein cyc_03831 [Cyclospora cayetanensis]|uniref:Uncharacterized protein n=1 Tax=Cyclospora cayetanensis TaxID=88456 RepID=A0A1D3D9C8_9EIME|nr:hypothetical protein cyc_03831 [Cyclospora cayetanensis]
MGTTSAACACEQKRPRGRALRLSAGCYAFRTVAWPPLLCIIRPLTCANRRENRGDEPSSLPSIGAPTLICVLRSFANCSHQAEVSAVCWLRNGEGAFASAAAQGFLLGGSFDEEAQQVFASGSYDGHIKIQDARQGDAKNLASHGLTLLEHQNRITRLAGAWDGRMLLSGDVDGVVKASSRIKARSG